MKKVNMLPVGALIIFSVIALTAMAQPGGSLTKQLVGEWRNRYVKVIMHNEKTGKATTMEADSATWEAKLHIKPIRTHFKNDGSYFSEYRNLKDSVVRIPSGLWSIKGDTLIMTELKPEKSVLKVHVKIEKGLVTFHGMIDFDGEGKENDEYFGEQRKVK